jgi:uncharacterized protein YbbC (DUF1343 family)
MNRTRNFQPGIVTLLRDHTAWLKGRRAGLLSHLAAVDGSGATTAELLRLHCRTNLKGLMGPEHGFLGHGDAGEEIPDRRHPFWRIPVYSLYGKTRRPGSELLRKFDVVVVDLQDLGTRCYTYVSTLRSLLEQAAACGTSVIVADRPIPLPRVVDGPTLHPAFESFVGCVRTPLSYGMTPGETALWLRQDLGLKLDLRVAPMTRYGRESRRRPDWPPWIPPSPAIRSWESAQCYAATVFCEALPAIDNGRSADLPFQLLGSPAIKARDLIRALAPADIRGAVLHPHPYAPSRGPLAHRLLDGIRICVTDPDHFKPVRTAVCILAAIQRLWGRTRLWRHAGSRPEFFDKLFGTDVVRRALWDGTAGPAVAALWETDVTAFARTRNPLLLYPPS